MKNFLICILLLLGASCAGPGAFVGFATASGNGDVRTDGDLFLALGELQGDAGVFMKGSGFPLTYPLNLDKGEWSAVNRSLELSEKGKLGVDPLPFWTYGLFRPGEVETLSARLGVQITFRPPNP